MEEEGTPPANEQYLLNEAESPCYRENGFKCFGKAYQRGGHTPRAATVEAGRPYEPCNPSTSVPLNLLQLLDESWYWKPNDSNSSKTHPQQINGQLRRSRSIHRSSHDANVQKHRLPSPESESALDQLHANAQAAEMSLRRSLSETCMLNESFRQASIADSDVQSDYSQESEPSAKGVRNPEDVDSIGTWGHRVIRFNHTPWSNSVKIPNTPEQKDLQSKQNLIRRQLSGKSEKSEGESEQAAADAAWRWRFNRRWRTEQAKQFDPEFGMDGGDEDGWDEALGYLDACGPGMHLQIGRTASNDSKVSMASGSLISSSGGWGLLVGESQKDKGGLAEENATANIASKARKVQDLYRHQQKIEKDVKAKWGDTKVSMSWAGHHMKAVDIDLTGQFQFILVKLVDSSRAHRILVRGRHGLSPVDMMKDVQKETKEICQRHRLPAVNVILLGTGVLQWSRDRRVDVSQGRIERNSEGVIQTNDDVVRLAGAITRSSLPAPTRVTVNGDKLS